jgi:hypothetical protein
LRIDDKIRTGKVAARGADRTAASGPEFRVADYSAAPRAASPAAATGPATALASLLTLQSVEDPGRHRRKLVRRGSELLDVLEEIKADLLVGRVGEGRLHRLAALVTQARDRGEPGLDALLDDIELRVQVELAKHGIFRNG